MVQKKWTVCLILNNPILNTMQFFGGHQGAKTRKFSAGTPQTTPHLPRNLDMLLLQ